MKEVNQFSQILGLFRLHLLWYQNPYPDSSSVYDLTKSKKYVDDNLTVLISHGHDDHCDDFIIKHHFSDNKILVPKFATNGLQKKN